MKHIMHDNIATINIIKCPPLRDHLAQCGLQYGLVLPVKVPNVPLTQCSQYVQYSGGDYYGTNYPALVLIVVMVLTTLTLSIFSPLIGNTSIMKGSAPLIQCEGGS